MGSCCSQPDQPPPQDPPRQLSDRPRIDGLPSNNAAAAQPFRPPSPLPSSPTDFPQHPPPWTRTQLATLRTQFFETRTEGHPAAWSALERMSELCRAGEVEEAGVVCTAAGLVMRGAGKRVWFDEAGRRYRVPKWCLIDPQDLVDEEKEVVVGEGMDGTEEGEMVKVPVRRVDGGRDVVVEVGVEWPVRVLVQRFREAGGVGEGRVRVMYTGKMLREEWSLRRYGWREGDVVQALVGAVENEG